MRPSQGLFASVLAALAFVAGPVSGQTTAFMAGTRPIFVEDLSVATVGSFPAHLQLEWGSVGVVEAEGRRFLRATSDFQLRIPLDERLPERFTFEFDMQGRGTTFYDGVVKIDFGKGETSDHVVCSPFEIGVYGRGGFERKAITNVKEMAKEWGDFNGVTFRCRMIVEGPSTNVFVEDRLVASSRPSDLGRRNYITLSSGRASANNPILIGNLRAMAFSQERIAVLPDAQAQALARVAPACAAPGTMVLAICPLEGAPGTAVSLAGRNLGEVVEVRFGSVRNVPFTIISDERVAFRVPELPTSSEREARVSVRTATGAGRYPASSDGQMQPFRRLPRIDSIRPLRAARDDTLKVFGSDLHLIERVIFQSSSANDTAESWPRLQAARAGRASGPTPAASGTDRSPEP